MSEGPGQGGILTTQDLEVLRAQQMLIVERQGAHGARLDAVEASQSSYQHDMRELRDLIRQQQRPAQADPNALAMHNMADAIRKMQERHDPAELVRQAVAAVGQRGGNGPLWAIMGGLVVVAAFLAWKVAMQ